LDELNLQGKIMGYELSFQEAQEKKWVYVFLGMNCKCSIMFKFKTKNGNSTFPSTIEYIFIKGLNFFFIHANIKKIVFFL